MRQGQQNRRGRGRNRKSQNPLTRSFESNGPDIKIRGTPSHIAEKYISLARDALASGDPVLAENYLQHAEHYNRIIMSYREQNAPQNESLNGSGDSRQRSRDAGEQGDAEDSQDAEELTSDHQPQPKAKNTDTANGQANEAASPEPRAERQERRPRRGNGARGGLRSRRSDPQREAEGSGNAAATAEETPVRNGANRDSFSEEDNQPNFLKRPVRRTRRAPVKSDKPSSTSDFEGSADKAAE